MELVGSTCYIEYPGILNELGDVEQLLESLAVLDKSFAHFFKLELLYLATGSFWIPINPEYIFGHQDMT